MNLCFVPQCQQSAKPFHARCQPPQRTTNCLGSNVARRTILTLERFRRFALRVTMFVMLAGASMLPGGVHAASSDIVWQDSISGARVLWLMNGTVLQGSNYVTTVTTDWTIAGTSDFNGDGKTDVLYQNTVTGAVVLWIMNGLAIQSSQSVFPTLPMNYQVSGVGD